MFILASTFQHDFPHLHLYLLAKTLDLVSGLTSGWWAFSGSVTALGINWVLTGYQLGVNLAQLGVYWVSTGYQGWTRSFLLPPKHSQGINLASGIIMRKMERVSFGTFNDRRSDLRLPKKTCRWEKSCSICNTTFAKCFSCILYPRKSDSYSCSNSYHSIRKLMQYPSSHRCVSRLNAEGREGWSQASPKVRQLEVRARRALRLVYQRL